MGVAEWCRRVPHWDGMMADEPSSQALHAVEAARGIYRETRDWYKVAETKAQLLLAFDGVVVGAIASATLGNRDELRALVRALSWLELGLLVASGLAFAGSIVLALCCARSALYPERQLDNELGVDGGTATHPRFLWFFQYYTRHDPDAVFEAFRTDPLLEARSIFANMRPLARNVTWKHRTVNWSFGCAVAGVLLLLVFATVSVLSARLG